METPLNNQKKDPDTPESESLYETIRRFILRRIRSRDQADDLTQEVWLRLMEQEPPIVQEKIRAWLYRTARNLIVDTIRYKDRRKEVLKKLEETIPKVDYNCGASITERKEEKQMIIDSINELEPNHREVVRLKFQEGLSYQEIAEVINKPKTTVAWLLHESLVLIREKMNVTTP